LIVRAEMRPTGGERARWLVDALDLILIWIERSQQRAQLAELDHLSLHDLALSKADIDAECGKHFWQR
jgi:uncharacterized protein YjiS (DUF1127 family)